MIIKKTLFILHPLKIKNAQPKLRKKCIAPIAATQFRYKVQYAKIEHAFLSWDRKTHTILFIGLLNCVAKIF